jgi:tripartite-type tricarboxylate transporter receptor subunit TctC
LYHKLGQRAAAIVAGVADPNFKARLLTLGVAANPLTSRAFGQFIADEIAKWAKVIKFANISR